MGVGQIYPPIVVHVFGYHTTREGHIKKKESCPTLSKFLWVVHFISHKHLSSLKASFKIELGSLNFNRCQPPLRPPKTLLHCVAPSVAPVLHLVHSVHRIAPVAPSIYSLKSATSVDSVHRIAHVPVDLRPQFIQCIELRLFLLRLLRTFLLISALSASNCVCSRCGCCALSASCCALTVLSEKFFIFVRIGSLGLEVLGGAILLTIACDPNFSPSILELKRRRLKLSDA